MSAPDTDAYVRLVEALRGHGLRVQESGNKARAQCPAHGSRGFTLSLRRGDGKVQVTCFAGCEAVDVLAAVGLGRRDFFDQPARPRMSKFPQARGAANALGCPEHFCDRILQQQQLEADPAYAAHQVELERWARPRADDYPGRLDRNGGGDDLDR